MCCSCRLEGLNRREFLGVSTLGIAGAALTWASSPRQAAWSPDRYKPSGRPLAVQPILLYEIPQRRPQTSWRSWGGIQTELQAAEEAQRIEKELAKLKQKADFDLIVKPVFRSRSAEETARLVSSGGYDIGVVYAAGGWTDLLEAGCSPNVDNLIFLRHRSGPVYLWYEIVHNRFLRQGGNGYNLDQFRYPAGMTVDDIVVDDTDQLLTRLRAIYGVRNFIGRRVLALGGASGWCNENAPQTAKEKFKLEIVEISYDELARRIRRARGDRVRLRTAEEAAERYLSLSETELNTQKVFVVNAFLLYDVLKELLSEHEAPVFTIMDCMSTVMPISETTACLTLSLLNDEGIPAVCESDFNALPAGILLHYLSGKPVFLNDPTFPHHGIVTCAHCTAPRRLDGSALARTRVVTHFESDFGAAPKVELPLETPVTMVCPDAGQQTWVGFSGAVIDNPFLDICRSQFDIRIDGDWRKLVRDHRGFHWLMAVGNYADELEFACRKIGINWENVSRT